MPVVIYLHAANINQLSTFCPGIGKLAKRIGLAGRKVTAAFNVERKGMKASLVARLSETHRIEDPHRYIEHLRALQNMAFAHTTMSAGYRR